MKENVSIAFYWIKVNLDDLSMLGHFNQQMTNS